MPSTTASNKENADQSNMAIDKKENNKMAEEDDLSSSNSDEDQLTEEEEEEEELAVDEDMADATDINYQDPEEQRQLRTRYRNLIDNAEGIRHIYKESICSLFISPSFLSIHCTSSSSSS